MIQPEFGKEFDRSILDASPELNLPARSEILDTDEELLIGAWADLPEHIRTRDLRWINDIVTHIDAIRSYTAHGQNAFDDPDQPWGDGIQMRIIKIGHAVRSLSSQFRSETYPHEMQSILGMRDRVAHNYLAVNDRIIWTAATERFPALAEKLRKILEDDNGAR